MSEGGSEKKEEKTNDEEEQMFNELASVAFDVEKAVKL